MRGFEKESGSIPGQVEPDGGVRVGDLPALLARAEATEGPDRYVKCWLACALDGYFADLQQWPERGFRSPTNQMSWRVDFCRYDEDGMIVRPGHGGDQMVRPYTASLDAALALNQRVLPGWTVASISQQDDKSWFVELREGYLTSYGRVAMSDTRPKTPALALLAAMLKAKIAEAASPGEGPSLATDEPK